MEEAPPEVAQGSLTTDESLASISMGGEDSMSEIPVNAPMRELSVRSGVADLPSAEEVRNDPSQAPQVGWTQKKIMLVGGGIIVLLAIIIGVSVGVSNKNKNQAATNTAASTDQAQRERLSAVASFLIDQDISYEFDVTTAGSPQNRAASFMAIEDGIQLQVPATEDDPLAYEFIQRYALATFYYSLGGESWDFSMNFLGPDRTCLWFQTLRTTTGQRNNFGASCNADGKISIILMPWNNMQGTIPAEVGLLTDLEFFAIPANRNINGVLPEQMKKLTKLEFIHVGNNALNGPVPEWIGGLTKLSSLALSDNAFQGSIPMSMRNLKKLSFLAMDGNTLYGQLDAVEQLTNLQYLYLEKNQLEQTLGSDTLRNLTKLEQLDLSDNILDGRVPRHLLHLSALDVLDLSSNILSGKLPGTIPRNPALNFLFLHGNQITGEIPSSFFNLTALNHLDLSDNRFTGQIPSFLGNLTNMVYLFLSNNDFDKAPIPEFLPELASLRDLSLKGTHRTGTVPSFLGEMKSLLLLDLDRNDLTGSLPSELGLMTYLGLLLLNRNQVRLFYLVVLHVLVSRFSLCKETPPQLTGTIPTEVSQMSNLGK